MKSTNELLNCTLMRLMQKDGIPSAVELCEEAGISRSALYRYHPDIVTKLQELRSGRNEPSDLKAKMVLLLSENKELKRKVEQLASLADHYFNAWQESEGLRHRQDRERARLSKIKIYPGGE